MAMPAAPALIVAAPSSGSGKTTLTLALLRHLRNQGVAAASFSLRSLNALWRFRLAASSPQTEQ